MVLTPPRVSDSTGGLLNKHRFLGPLPEILIQENKGRCPRFFTSNKISGVVSATIPRLGDIDTCPRLASPGTLLEMQTLTLPRPTA